MHNQHRLQPLRSAFRQTRRIPRFHAARLAHAGIRVRYIVSDQRTVDASPSTNPCTPIPGLCDVLTVRILKIDEQLPHARLSEIVRSERPGGDDYTAT